MLKNVGINLVVETAQELALQGYRIFPCQVEGKKPIIEKWQDRATTDVGQIDDWWRKDPNYNIGLVTQGMLVVDIDAPEHPWYDHAWLDCPMQRTPRGGSHFVFRAPDGMSYRNTTKVLADKIDTRADGGYIIVAPSRVVGSPYTWERPLVPFAELPEVPAWLFMELEKAGKQPSTPPATITAPRAAQDAHDDGTNRIPEGRRNQTLAALAGTMRRAGMGEAEILAALTATNQTRCVPQMEDKEIRQIAHSIARYEPHQATVAAVEGHWAAMQENDEPDEDEEDEAPRYADPGRMPSKFLDVPGTIGSVIEYNLKTAHCKQPELALAGAISLQSVLAGRKIRDQYNNRTNLYLIGVGESGSGKDHARQINRTLLNRANLDLLEGAEDFASDAGLINQLSHRLVMLSQIDEIGRFLATANNSTSSFQQNIIKAFLLLYSSANTVYKGRGQADVTKIKEIVEPCFSLYGTTVPGRLYQGLTNDNIIEGFLPRFLVFEGEENPKRGSGSAAEPPKFLMDRMEYWRLYSPGGNMSSLNPNPQLVEHTPEALAYVEVILDEIDAIMLNCDSAGKAMWSRVFELSCRLALCYAASRDPMNMVIDLPALEWAYGLTSFLVRRVLFRMQDWISSGFWDQQQNIIVRLLREAGPEGLSTSSLYNKTRAMGPDVRGKVIETLIECGIITFNQLPSGKQGGRPKMIYRLKKI